MTIKIASPSATAPCQVNALFLHKTRLFKNTLKKLHYLATMLLLSTSLPLFADTQYGTNATEWRVADDIPAGASIMLTQDPILNRGVIATNGAGTANSFIVGGNTSSDGWNNLDEFFVSWRMRTSEDYQFFVRVETLFGDRYLNYNQSNRNYLLNSTDRSIHHGLGSTSRDGEWHTWSRDLNLDLRDAEPNNALISVNGVIVRGNVFLDDLSLTADNPIDPGNSEDPVIYSDGDRNTLENWSVFDNFPGNSQISYIRDPDNNGNNVVQFSGSGIDNSYILGSINTNIGLNNTQHKFVSWRSRATDNYRVYVHVSTPQGWRYLWYDTNSTDLLANGLPNYIHHGLGTSSRSGQWRTFSRDLNADLQDAEPNNTVTSVNAVVVRGSFMMDDLTLSVDGRPDSVINNPNQPIDNPPADQVAPSIEFINPVNESMLSDQPIRGLVLDQGGSGIAEVRITIRDICAEGYVDLNGNPTSSTRSFRANLTNQSIDRANWSINHSLPISTYEITAYGIDNEGNADLTSYSVIAY